MKKLTYFFIAITATATFVSCKKDFLDVPPQGQAKSENFWKSREDADKALNAMYANLREWKQVAFAPIAIESLGSDEAEKGSDPGDASFLNQYDDFSVTSTQGQIQDFWAGQYQEINLCNQILDNVDTMSTIGTDVKTLFKAQAKCIRAYSYFRLVRAFGDVPLLLKLPQTAADFNKPRSSKTDVYAAIEADLNDAAANLPVSYAAAEKGKVTKGAALGLLAKVSMYQQKWQQVYNATEQIKALGIYSLIPNYESIFRIPQENGSESVFEIQADLIPGNSDGSNSQYSQVQGVRGVTGGGWGFNVPTTTLSDAYETGDPRKDATIIFRGETTPQGDAIPASVPNAMYNQKSYVPFSLFVTGFNEGCQQNVRVMRYAEVLLMNAEAANELGNSAAALQSLELVRARARGANNAILPAVTTTDKVQLRTAIWRERQVELAMEFDRYFDVIRQGRASQVFGPKGWKANKNEVWPIPQNEIDKSAGVLSQNTGY